MNKEEVIKEFSIEFNERVARAMGWTKWWYGDIWINDRGGIVSRLPDFLGNKDDAQVAVRYFESYEARSKGLYGKFFSRYEERMGPEEICFLAIEILEKQKKHKG